MINGVMNIVAAVLFAMVYLFGNMGVMWLWIGAAYLVLGILAVLILIPVLWVMVASVKETTEHYGSPWALPTHIHWQNFVNAWTKANMGGYMLHSVTVTGLALAILLVVAVPASYCLARFHFVGRRFLNTCFMAGLFVSIL